MDAVEVTTVTPTIGGDLVPFEQMQDRLSQRRAFVAQQLKEGIDYGKVPGVSKPFMWKSGAEKLLELHGFLPQLTRVDAIEDRGLTPPYFEFTYRCDVLHVATQTLVKLGAEGTCNNRERKYYDDRTGESKGDAWVQRNTVAKMAQKRAIVAGSLMVTSLSCDFTQDEEAVSASSNNTHSPTIAPSSGFAGHGGAPQSPPNFEAPTQVVPPQAQKFTPPVSPPATRPVGAPVHDPSRAPRNPLENASEKQGKYIYRLCKEQNIELDVMFDNLRTAYGDHVQRFEDLSKQEASDVIESMTGGN